jgi:hypothetical protein
MYPNRLARKTLLTSDKRVLANKTLNKRKGEVMNAGKQVLGHARSTSRTNIPSKSDPEDPFALGSPFSTPQREGIAANVTNFNGSSALDSGLWSSSPYIPGMHVMGVGSPAMSSTSENLTRSLKRGNFPASTYERAVNTPTPTRFHRPSSGIGGLHGTANAQCSLFEQGNLARNSMNAVQGLENTLPNINPIDRANLAQQYQAVYAAGANSGLSHPPPGMVKNHQMTAHSVYPQLTSSITPPLLTTSETSRLPGAAAGHYRKRSRHNSEGSEYLPPSEKRAHR